MKLDSGSTKDVTLTVNNRHVALSLHGLISEVTDNH